MKKIFLPVCAFLCLTINKSYAQNQWPAEVWTSSINLTSLDADFNVNMSGQFWNPVKRELWVVSNSGFFWKLKEGGPLGFMIDTIGGNAKWNPGGDLEDITQSDLNDSSVFVMNEYGYIEEYKTSVHGNINKLHSWNIIAQAGPDAGNGPEGITFVPDEWLSYNSFVDKNGNPYTSVNGMGGLMFVAHQTGGYIYVFDLKRNDNSYIFVGKYATGYSESSGLAFDRSIGKMYIWHNTGANYIEVTKLNSYYLSPGIRKFYVQTSFLGPKTGNLEGIAFTPASAEENWYFATDDSNQNGYAVFWFNNFKPCVFAPFFKANNTKACVGENIMFTDTTVGLCGAETFLWNFGADASPATATGQGPHEVSYLSPGVKNIKLKVNGLFADSLEKNSYISINANPVISITTSSLSVCSGSSVSLTAGGASVYNWSSQDSTADIIVFPDSTTLYTVTATDTNGCVNTISQTVTVLHPVTTSQTLTICYGSSITVGSNTYAGSGIYIDTLAGTNNCDSIIITNLTVENAIDITTSINGTTITSDAIEANYQWIDCNNGNTIITGETNQNYTAIQNGSFAVIVTINNCIDTSNCVTITDVGVNNITFSDEQIKIYPNPSVNGIFYLKNFTNEKIQKLLLYDKLSRSCDFSYNQYNQIVIPYYGQFILCIKTDKRNIYKKLIHIP